MALAASSTVSVSGTLQTIANKPLHASLTLHDLSTTRTSGQAPFDHQFATKSDGTFTLTGVPAGKYEICVDAPQENVLDPCVWSTPAVVNVSGTTPVTGIALKVETGYTLKVHVNDPQNLLPATKGGVAGQALAMGLITHTNRYINLRLLGAASTAVRDHYIVAPFDQTLTLSISSATLALSDTANGQRYSGDSLRIPVRVATGGTAVPVSVTVAKR